MADGPIIMTTAKPRSWLARGTAIALIFGLVVILPLGLTMRGCDDGVSADIQSVKIGDQWFHLEIAADDRVRMKGLGQRTHIDDDGGMLFIFKEPQPTDHGFVMRDCPIDIDIIYLDGAGRIGNWHAMKAAPREAGEGAVGETGYDEKGNRVKISAGAEAYEKRLIPYEARYVYQFAIELKGGTIDAKLKGKLKEGDRIDLPVEALKRRAR